MIYIFDLDGTVIDSSHRYRTLPDGGIDLPAWIELNTPENVAKDSPLPMAGMMRGAFERGDTVLACTSRVLNWWDFESFANLDIRYHEIMHRPEGLALNDADYKEMHLRLYAQGMGISWARFCSQAVMYDDADTVLERMAKIGITCHDARFYNASLTKRIEAFAS